jgi:DNA-binding transcriptional regulator YiaG
MEIKKLRKQMGLTQDKFAALIGVAPYTVRRWENEGVKPSPLATEKIEAITKYEPALSSRISSHRP